MSQAISASDLVKQRCQACEGGVAALTPQQLQQALASLPGWELAGGEIARTFKFANYHETMAFVNATAWISHHEDHHPDLEVGYNRCRVRYSTHSVGGITLNDLICAAKVSALIGERKQP